MGKHYRPPGKKKEGNAARYVTRSQAVKHLQVTLPVFRRLCIIKVAVPHIGLIGLSGRGTPSLWMHLETWMTVLRWCIFFAALPALEREKIEVKRIHNCRRLTHEWQAYISRTHKLRKTFISVKGIYYQAEVEGQKITWLTPHSLQQVLNNDVDFNVMQTFLEVYERLLALVNFHLYNSINVKYPPILDPRLEALAADLYALSRYVDGNARASVMDPQASSLSGSEQVEDQQKGVTNEESELRLAQLHHQLPSNEPGALMHLVEDVNGENEEDQDTRDCRKLFKNMKFFLSREVPRESLVFIIPAFGGVVSWEGEGSPFKESDETITHQIVDRPAQGHIFLSREYVQPQWVYDCVNARIVLPTEDYMVGRIPPPHLNEVLPLPGVGNEDLEDPQNLLVKGIADRAEVNETAQRKQKMMIREKQYHDELKMELQGAQFSSTSNIDILSSGGVTETGGDSLTNSQQNDGDIREALMSRRKRKLLEAMKISKGNKRANVDRLKKRKKQIEEDKRLKT
ncbi:Pescadillo-like [Quillaja saponaria]|uniref:Pescadillo-like n=1 Tax=Quillaja saponaria TaxID=32244 RepID=A0AAD7VGD6_QUISA|nr:Pescadillo-like [Quillaja saponaria]